MAVTDVPRTAVKLSLQAVRLPLSTVELLTHHTKDDGSWPPAVVFERLEATTKRFVGTLLRDEDLLTEANLQTVHASQVADALRFEAEAEQARLKAQEQFEEDREEILDDRRRTERQADVRQRKIDEDRQRAEAKAAADRRKRAASAAANKARRERTVADREHAAAVTRNRVQTAAVAAKRRAVNAAEEVDDLDAKLESKKARRKGA